MRACSRARAAAAICVLVLSGSDEARSTPLAPVMARPSVPLIRLATGLAMKRDVPMTDLTLEETRARLSAEIDRELSTIDVVGQMELHAQLGFLPFGVDLKQVYLTLLTSQLAAFYDTRTGAFFNVQRLGVLDLLGEPVVVAHELTHAAQDQALGGQAFFDARRDDDDRTRALQWLMEGQATVVGNRIGNVLGLPLPGPLGLIWGEATTALMWTPWWTRLAKLSTLMAEGPSVPDFIADGLLSAYVDGSRFFWSVERAIGHPAHQFLLCHPPQSTEEMLDPHKYLRADDPPARVTLPSLGGSAVRTEATAGAWSMRWLLERAGDAPELVDGWHGDRMALMDNGLAVWRVVMDRDAQARRLAPVLRKAIGGEGRQDLLVTARGREVHVFSGPDALLAAPFSDELARAALSVHAPDPPVASREQCAADQGALRAKGGLR